MPLSAFVLPIRTYTAAAGMYELGRVDSGCRRGGGGTGLWVNACDSFSSLSLYIIYPAKHYYHIQDL